MGEVLDLYYMIFEEDSGDVHFIWLWRLCPKSNVFARETQYVSEITKYLNSSGLSMNDDYILYSDVLDSIAMLYWNKSVSRWGHGV